MPVDLGYSARAPFVPFHARRQRWAVMVAHRRAGKTVACVMDLIDAALRRTKQDARFAYVAPTYTQAKDVAWLYLKRFTAPLPGCEQRESDLIVNLPNGARVRLYGADNYDRLRGLYFDGIVLDEYGDMDPRAWPEVVRPALSDRQGWAVFIGTPKGRNHFAEVWDGAAGEDGWFRSMLRASETGLIEADELADARKAMTDDQYDQEYECSFTAAVVGAYYARDLNAADADKRITRVVWDPRLPVHTAWDLGFRDHTVVWMFQKAGGEVRLIDYYEDSTKPLGDYVNALRTRPYTWGTHILPHDAAQTEYISGTTRLATLQGHGLVCHLLPRTNPAERINAARLLLPRCVFDAEKCRRGLEALRNYRREWNDKLKVFAQNPLHDWSSHAADAFGHLAEGVDAVSAANDSWSKPLKYAAGGIV